jgi:beta-lactamase class D
MRCMVPVLTVLAVSYGAGGAGLSGAAPESCFLLYDEQDGRTTREPSEACSTRVTPASTFKIPHALAALDAGVLSGTHEVLPYDGTPLPFERWKRDHDLASAMSNSVVWYFQRIAERLGVEREREYLEAFEYGNQDASGPLTSFWLGDSLKISPDEQLSFLRRFFEGKLPVGNEAARSVREILVQPPGRIVNAAGEHPFLDPWPEGTTVYAKTGSGADDGRRAMWLVGRVERGGRGWIFVSCVVGSDEPLAAISLAATGLSDAKVLRD